MKEIELFFCYAQKDEKYLKELQKQLIPLQKKKLIGMWCDRDIDAGAEWQREIDSHLNTAHIILLLISPDFMASDYCYSVELEQAIMRHERGDARVIPIILRPVYWEGTLGRLTALPTNTKPITSWPKQGQAFFNVSEGIRRVVEKLISSTSSVENISDDKKGEANTNREPLTPLNISQLPIWPEVDDYDQGFRNMAVTVYDPSIQTEALAFDSLPLHLNSGTKRYVVVYKLGNWVVKCFCRDTSAREIAIIPPADLRERYQAIAEYTNLHSSVLPFLVPYTWVERGIRLNGQDWPFIKSPFLIAPTLGEFLEQNDLDKHRSTVAYLAKQWLTIITTLESLHIAHGDLDTTNVLVLGTLPHITLRLVDFDNMYVPALQGRTLYEHGHKHFQPVHPQIRRFNHEMDRFSVLVIYLSLIGLSEDPQLWNECAADGDAKLLLGADDFSDLEASPSYKLLRTKRGNLELQRCLEELVRSIEENKMPRSLSDFLMRG